MLCSRIVCIIVTCNYIGKKKTSTPPGYRLISWLFCKLLLCFLGYLSGSVQQGIHYKLHIHIDERYYSKLNFTAIEWIMIYNYSFYDVEVSWACAYQPISFCSWRCCFLAAVVPDISQMVDLNESCEHTLAGHSSHLQIFSCDLQSVVSHLSPGFKWNHQHKETVTSYSLFLAGALNWEWTTKERSVKVRNV